MKIFIPWGLTGTDARWINNATIVDSVEEADIILFCGGADINPKIYGCIKHISTNCYDRRDDLEIDCFNKIRPDQFVIGQCRGAQLLCALNGGKLIQNVHGHCSGPHKIVRIDDTNPFIITSIHHQMMYPFELDMKDYTTLYKAEHRLSDVYEGDGTHTPPYDPEIVLFHKEGMPKCLAIQGHPEMMSLDSPIISELNDIINNVMGM